MNLNQKIFKYAIYYPLVCIKAPGIPFYLRRLQKTQYLDPATLKAIQLNKLRELLAYAKRCVPYYSTELPMCADMKFNSLEDMKSLPFITKTMIQSFAREFVTTECLRALTKKTTGGSTGEPVTIWKTSKAMAQELAATWRGYSWAGIDIGDRQARFWGVPFRPKERYRAKLIDFVANRKRCSAFAFDQSHLRYYTERLSSFNPKYFYGYVSMLVEYANYFLRRNETPPFKLICIITTSEVLTSHDRNLLETVFSARVFNEYGCGELGSVAHECEKGSLHVMAENMIVEVLDGERSCAPKEVGELVITELNNHAMPLIRYRTGDYAALAKDPCQCGRTLPVIKELKGRAYDMVRNKEGKLFHGEFFMYIFEEAKRNGLGIGGFQVVQTDYDRFTIKIKPESGYGKSTEEFIRKRIKDGFDAGAKVDFEKVDCISRERSGKIRLIKGMAAGEGQ